MANPPKNIVQQMAQIARDAGEAVKEEVKEVGQTAISQVTGVEKVSTGGGKPSDQQSKRSTQDPQQLAAQIELDKRTKKAQQELSFYRRQLAEMKREVQKVQQEKTEKEQLEEQEEMIKQAQLQQAQISGGPITAPGGASKRGTALIGGKKRKKGFEIGGAGAKHSK